MGGTGALAEHVISKEEEVFEWCVDLFCSFDYYLHSEFSLSSWTCKFFHTRGCGVRVVPKINHMQNKEARFLVSSPIGYIHGGIRVCFTVWKIQDFMWEYRTNHLITQLNCVSFSHTCSCLLSAALTSHYLPSLAEASREEPRLLYTLADFALYSMLRLQEYL